MSEPPPKSLPRRLGWFALIWLLSVTALGAIAWLIRAALL